MIGYNEAQISIALKTAKYLVQINSRFLRRHEHVLII